MLLPHHSRWLQTGDWLAQFMDEDYEEEEILENALQCPTCTELTAHDVLNEKNKGAGVDLLVRCVDCSHTHTVHIRRPIEILIPFILSDGAFSTREKIEVDNDELFELEDLFEHNEMVWRVHQIQAKDKTYHNRLIAEDVEVINAIRIDMIRVKLTCTSGERSYPDSIFVPYDTKFKAGSLYEHNGRQWNIRAIHTGSGRTMRGNVACQNIKRIYLHEPEDEKSFEPKTPRERRQAWKEGRLGYNPNPIKPQDNKHSSDKHNRNRKKKR